METFSKFDYFRRQTSPEAGNFLVAIFKPVQTKRTKALVDSVMSYEAIYVGAWWLFREMRLLRRSGCLTELIRPWGRQRQSEEIASFKAWLKRDEISSSIAPSRPVGALGEYRPPLRYALGIVEGFLASHWR